MLMWQIHSILATVGERLEICQREDSDHTTMLRGGLSNFVQLCDCAIFGRLTMTLTEKSVLARTRIIVQLCDYLSNLQLHNCTIAHVQVKRAFFEHLSGSPVI